MPADSRPQTRDRPITPAPFGPCWDLVDGPPPWPRSGPEPCGLDRLLRARAELLSPDATLLDVVEYASDFSREHGRSSTNLEGFLATGSFVSDEDVPMDLDDTQRCLHKLAFAIVDDESSVIARMNALCDDADDARPVSTAEQAFRTLLCYLPVATYLCLLHREGRHLYNYVT